METKHFIVSATHESFGTEGKSLFLGTEDQAETVAKRIAIAGGHGWQPQYRDATEQEIADERAY